MQIRSSYGGGKSEFYGRLIGYHLNPNASLWFPVTRQTRAWAKKMVKALLIPLQIN